MRRPAEGEREDRPGQQLMPALSATDYIEARSDVCKYHYWRIECGTLV